MNKKGMELGINLIVIFAISLVVLIVMIGWFLGGVSGIGGALRGVSGDAEDKADTTNFSQGIEDAIGGIGAIGGSGGSSGSEQVYVCCKYTVGGGYDVYNACGTGYTRASWSTSVGGHCSYRCSDATDSQVCCQNYCKSMGDDYVSYNSNECTCRS
ncbi:MAG: hypothetical protein ABIG20_02120 [archaeon]